MFRPTTLRSAHPTLRALLISTFALALAACSFGAVAGRSPLEVMEDQPAAGVGFVAAVGVLAGLELVAFTALPGARKSARVTRS